MNDDINDVKSRIIEGSGYGEFKFDGSLTPYLETYSNYKMVNINGSRILATINYIKCIAELINNNCPDEDIKNEFLQYLSDNNYILENVNEKIKDINDKINIIQDSDYNIHQLINDNENNLDSDSIKSLEELFKYLNEESQEVVTSIEDFKNNLINTYKSEIEAILVANITLNKAVGDYESLMEDFVVAINEGDEVEMNRIKEKIQLKFNETLDSGNISISAGNINIKIDPLASLDLSQDLNNPNLLEVKDNVELTSEEFMDMLNTKGEEYATEYIYTLPEEKRDKFFTLMDL